MKNIIVICGPTGVGKTKLSIELAKKIDGEIINADMVSLYKKLNIGSSKVTKEEMGGIKHHLIDILDVNDIYNVYNYQKYGRKVIDNILKKNKKVIIVGGTALYIKALLYDYDFKSNNSNKLLYDALFIGLNTDRSKLYDLINIRVDNMIKNNLLDEVYYLYNNYKDSRIINTAIGYKEFIPYFNNTINLDEAIDNIKKNSRHYAKRQITFFKNKFDINWFNIDINNFDNTVNKVYEFINKD